MLDAAAALQTRGVSGVWKVTPRDASFRPTAAARLTKKKATRCVVAEPSAERESVELQSFELETVFWR